MRDRGAVVHDRARVQNDLLDHLEPVAIHRCDASWAMRDQSNTANAQRSKDLRAEPVLAEHFAALEHARLGGTTHARAEISDEIDRARALSRDHPRDRGKIEAQVREFK